MALPDPRDRHRRAVLVDRCETEIEQHFSAPRAENASSEHFPMQRLARMRSGDRMD
jgi:hypothetical protein